LSAGTVSSQALVAWTGSKDLAVSTAGDGATLCLLANLSDQAINHAASGAKGTLIWGNELNGSVPPWSVLWRIG